MDFRHHATDVLFGALLGTVVSYFCYRQYFPALNSPQSHLPFAPRFPEVERPGSAEETDGNGIPMANQPGRHDLETGTLGRRRRAGEDEGGAHVDGTVPREHPESLGTMWATPRQQSPAAAAVA